MACVAKSAVARTVSGHNDVAVISDTKRSLTTLTICTLLQNNRMALLKLVRQWRRPWTVPTKPTFKLACLAYAFLFSCLAKFWCPTRVSFWTPAFAGRVYGGRSTTRKHSPSIRPWTRVELCGIWCDTCVRPRDLWSITASTADRRPALSWTVGFVTFLHLDLSQCSTVVLTLL